MTVWQLQEAKNTLSEVIRSRAGGRASGDHAPRSRGSGSCAVRPLPEADGALAMPGDFFIASPLRDSGLIVERDPRTDLREIEL